MTSVTILAQSPYLLLHIFSLFKQEIGKNHKIDLYLVCYCYCTKFNNLVFGEKNPPQFWCHSPLQEQTEDNVYIRSYLNPVPDRPDPYLNDYPYPDTYPDTDKPIYDYGASDPEDDKSISNTETSEQEQDQPIYDYGASEENSSNVQEIDRPFNDLVELEDNSSNGQELDRPVYD